MKTVLMTLLLGGLAWALPTSISLDFDKLPAEQALQKLARQCNLDLALFATPQGTVSLHLKGVSPQQALDEILKQCGGKYGARIEGERLLVLANPDTLPVVMRRYYNNIPLSATPSAALWQHAMAAGSPYLSAQTMPASAPANTESYSLIEENGYQAVADKPLSTFSADVDTASYSNLRRFLREGQLPPRDSVRIEEMLNYFRYEYALPRADEAVSISSRVSSCPWQPKHLLLQVGVNTRCLQPDQVPPRNLVFLVDVSGSMYAYDRLPLAISALTELVGRLRAQDRVSLVVYAGRAAVMLEPTSGEKHGQIREALQALTAGGSTHGSEGIQTAYALCRQNFKAGQVNRVVLCTDGDFNVGVTSQAELLQLVESESKGGIFLTVLGFGRGNLKDATMEMLADKSNGNYAYVDDLQEARKVLIEEGGATLVTAAKDVKLQVEFNPGRVAGYRLVGYENRKLEDKDFKNDKKDAGELGYGHSTTVLYELVPVGQEIPDRPDATELRYQKPTGLKPSGEMAFVRVRYKRPEEEVSRELNQAVPPPLLVAAPEGDLKFASAVAGLGMLLRKSPHATLSYAQIIHWAEQSGKKDPQRLEFVELARKAQELSRAEI